MEFNSIDIKVDLERSKVNIVGITKEDKLNESKVLRRSYPLFPEASKPKEANEQKLQEIWSLINNAKFLNDIRPRSFYNLIHEIAEVIEPGYDGDEFGKNYIDEE